MTRRTKPPLKPCKSCKQETPHHQCRTGDPGCLHCSLCGEMLRKRPLRANDEYSPFPPEVDPEQLRIGAEIESREHNLSPQAGRKVALEHIAEDPNYYPKLSKMEKGSPLWGWDGLFKF